MPIVQRSVAAERPLRLFISNRLTVSRHIASLHIRRRQRLIPRVQPTPRLRQVLQAIQVLPAMDLKHPAEPLIVQQERACNLMVHACSRPAVRIPAVRPAILLDLAHLIPRALTAPVKQLTVQQAQASNPTAHVCRVAQDMTPTAHPALLLMAADQVILQGQHLAALCFAHLAAQCKLMAPVCRRVLAHPMVAIRHQAATQPMITCQFASNQS